MKKLLIASSVALALVSPFAVAAVAETSTSTPLTMLEVSKKLDQAGYKNIRDIEFEEGVFKVKAMDAQGKKVEFKVNAVNGTIPPVAKSVVYLTMAQVIEKTQAAGYKTIKEVEFEHNHYKVKAIDSHGDKVKLKVDATTGVISKD